MNISTLDSAIIAVYLLVVVVIAVVTSRRVRSTSDFFLAGRSMRWPFVGASMFATNISAEQFVGQAGLVFVVGLAVANYQLAGVLAFVAMGAIFLPIYMRLGLYTTPEFLERRYGPESRRFFSFITLVSITFAGIPGSLYAGGRVMEVLFGFESIVPGVLILALAAGPYAMAGGLRTVILTDFIQCLLLVVGGVAMLWMGLGYLGGWGVFETRIQELQGADNWDMLALIQPLDHPNVPWTGVVLGLTIHALAFGATSHVMVQRALAARSVHEARMGGLLAGLLKVVAVFIILIPGLMGYVMAQGAQPLIEVSSPDQLYPAMVQALLPVGLVGLVLAGLIAALMSSLDSEICAASGLFAMDWYQPYRPCGDSAALGMGGAHPGRYRSCRRGVLGDCGHSAVPLSLRISGQVWLLHTRHYCSVFPVGHGVEAAHAQRGFCDPYRWFHFWRLPVAGQRLGGAQPAGLWRRGIGAGLFGDALSARGLRHFCRGQRTAFRL